ncbi:MAG: diguanylate cyclase [Polyangiaceae bacterium]
MRCFFLGCDAEMQALQSGLQSAGLEVQRVASAAELSRELQGSGATLVVVGPTNVRPPAQTAVDDSIVVWVALHTGVLAEARSLLDQGYFDVWSVADPALSLRIEQTVMAARRQQHLAARVRALRASRSRYRALVQNALDIIAVLDHSGIIRYASPALERVLGYEPHEVRGRRLEELVHADDLQTARSALEESAVEGVSVRVEFRVRHKGGEWRYLEAVADNLIGYPSITGIVVNARDVTDRRDLEEILMQQAFFDGLTGLPNRALFMDRVEHALAQREREPGAPALLFIDLDGFKFINDSYGHDVGDAALVAVARRVDSLCRAGDTAARLGGDEFTLLLESVQSPEVALEVADRVIQSLRRGVHVGDMDLTITVSVGVACYEHGVDARELIRRADTAMYRAKELGKDQYLLWVPRHDTERPPRSRTPFA